MLLFLFDYAIVFLIKINYIWILYVKISGIFQVDYIWIPVKITDYYKKWVQIDIDLDVKLTLACSTLSYFILRNSHE